MEKDTENPSLTQFRNTRSKALVYLFEELEKTIPEVDTNERHRGKTIQLKLSDEELR